MSRSLEARVKLLLNIFPYGVSVGADNHRTLDGTVIYKLSFEYDVCVPLGKIHVYIGNFFYKLFVRHIINSLVRYAAQNGEY